MPLWVRLRRIYLRLDFLKENELCKWKEDDINKNFDKFTAIVFPDSQDCIQQKLQNNATKNLVRA